MLKTGEAGLVPAPVIGSPSLIKQVPRRGRSESMGKKTRSGLAAELPLVATAESSCAPAETRDAVALLLDEELLEGLYPT